jgi:hypothetical protein
VNVSQPRSNGNGKHNQQSQHGKEPPVFSGEANLGEASFATSKPPSAQPVHVLHPRAKQVINLNLDFDPHLSASFAFSAKGMVHPMGEDHEAATRECDNNFAPVRRKSISKICTGADQH